jgi:hypothetical protein
MSRSGYSDDYEFSMLWEQAVKRAATGYRGQHLLKKLLDALDAMPVKRLITDEIKDHHGDVCAFGALDSTVTAYDRDDLAKHFNIAPALAADIVYMNDEVGWRETPEERWSRMRAWVDGLIRREQPEPK